MSQLDIFPRRLFDQPIKANFQSVEFSERAEILLFTRENVALKMNRLLRLSNISLSKIPPARDIPLTGNLPLDCCKLFRLDIFPPSGNPA